MFVQAFAILITIIEGEGEEEEEEEEEEDTYTPYGAFKNVMHLTVIKHLDKNNIRNHYITF